MCLHGWPPVLAKAPARQPLKAPITLNDVLDVSNAERLQPVQSHSAQTA